MPLKRMKLWTPAPVTSAMSHCKCSWCEYGRDPGDNGICSTCHAQFKALLCSSRWKKYRLSRLADPATTFCCDPFKLHWHRQTNVPIATVATVIDHILPWRFHPSLFWEPTNHQSLCHGCHGQKTQIDGSFANQPKGWKP